MMVRSTGFLYPYTYCNHSNFRFHTVYIYNYVSTYVTYQSYEQAMMATSNTNVWQDKQRVSVRTHTHVHACVWEKCFLLGERTCMRETFRYVCACTHKCRRKRNVFCWAHNIYLQHCAKWVAVQLAEALCCICSKDDNNPTIHVTFPFTDFIVRWEQNVHLACNEEKLHKISVHTLNILCIVRDCL
jgi:hypothetical protein